MRYTDHKSVEELKIAYVGGGSQGWAWGLMSDLADAGDLSGEVALYDINKAAAERNAIIGNRFNDLPEGKSKWNYYATDTLEQALTGADFVVISIQPGTLDEMEVDVHLPEKYGIYQSVGDTAGPGGIIRALRTLPMMEVIAKAVRDYCPKAWVINYTNPMALCVKALYNTFPEIQAFGCCHEVFGTQKLLVKALEDICGIKDVKREEIKVNVVGVNHFTWLTSATWHGMDLFPIYRQFAEKYKGTGTAVNAGSNWMNKFFLCDNRAKFDLFLRHGWIAAAGDRHLAEFCPKNWYLADAECPKKWGFELTPVSLRRQQLAQRNETGAKRASGEEPVKLAKTGEEGVLQMRALLGLSDLVTNVNIPNVGQIPNLPLGAVVETNAAFRDGTLTPVCAGEVPREIVALIQRNVSEQLLVAEAVKERDLEKAFLAFANDPLVDLAPAEARKLFDEMIQGTKQYLNDYCL